MVKKYHYGVVQSGDGAKNDIKSFGKVFEKGSKSTLCRNHTLI